MIGKEILDAILPVPSLDEAKEEKIAELKDEGFVVTNFHSGGVFYTLLLIILRIQIELTELLRVVLNNSLVSHAAGAWLDLKASDYSKTRKQAQKAQGLVTVSRSAEGEAIRIPKGHVFKTIKDINGEELRFFALEDAVLQRSAEAVDVPVEAEQAGSNYNVPAGQITRTLTYLGDVAITNSGGWLTREGSDTEDDESLRARCLRAWSELALVPVHDTYVNVCEAIPGVLYVKVDDQHPRGQGTIDIIVTSEAGAATDDLLAKVQAACDEIKAPDDDVLVMSAEVVEQSISVTVTIPSSVSQEGVADQVAAAITDLLKLRGRRDFNELTHADIIYSVKSKVSSIRNVTVTEPAADLFLESDKVIMPGTITVTIEEV